LIILTVSAIVAPDSVQQKTKKKGKL